MSDAAHTVHIVDDDADVRNSLGLLLQTLGHTVETFASGDIYLASGAGGDGVVVLLDVRMPGRDGLETLRALLGAQPRLPVVMMSGHGDIPLAVKAMQAGARDFVEKPFEAARIVELLGRLRDGAQGGEDPLAALSPREREIAEKLAEGTLNKVIAHELGISVRTVETHRARIMLKLGIRSVAELVRLVLSHP